jgi:hypothetical protein
MSTTAALRQEGPILIPTIRIMLNAATLIERWIIPIWWRPVHAYRRPVEGGLQAKNRIALAMLDASPIR